MTRKVTMSIVMVVGFLALVWLVPRQDRVSASAAGATSAAKAATATEATSAAKAASATEATSAAKAASAYVVHFDPATGTIKTDQTQPSSAPALYGEELRRALSTSSEGLKEIPSPVEGGGTMVDLRGRFRSAMVVQRDEDGKLSIPCVSQVPETTADDESANQGEE